MSEENRMQKIISLAKRRGFIYQGSEIYGGLAGTWDYGPLGIALKRNITNLWWKRFVDDRSDMYGVDAAILMNSKVWEASGHVDGFADPLVEDTKTKKRYRADHLLEDKGIDAAGMTPEEMNAAIAENDIQSPDGNPLGEVQQFNMMFKTNIGAVEDSSSVSYLRPETAQGMFVNFKNIIDSFHPKLPFGIAQIGKAFRNEITPRDFLFRTREFEQMEIEYFIHPDEWEKHFDEWQRELREWNAFIGLDEERIIERVIPEGEGAHYALKTIDFEFKYSFGQKELFGLAYRTDYDLKKHHDGSGESLEYFDQQSGDRFIPHVIEPSLGVDRTILALLESVYSEEEVDGDTRTVLKFKPHVAPVMVAVLPLLRKDGLPEKAQEVFEGLRDVFVCQYDETASIGKRYRRQDEIGTPFCITIDHDTLEDDTVTIRDRDSMEQDRVPVKELESYIQERIS
ncbi:MAG: glycine--tRNA ligase [Candidatus Paceibacterota bacterium]